jgi:hypothetical protein
MTYFNPLQRSHWDENGLGYYPFSSMFKKVGNRG